MGKPLAITRTEHAAKDLRAVAAKSRDGAQVRRLLALAFILDGHSLRGDNQGESRIASPKMLPEASRIPSF